MNFLKTKEVEVAGNQLTISEISGLDRFEFLNFCSYLYKPEPLIEPSESASEKEKQEYVEELNRNFNEWRESSFTAQARLVAHGCKQLGDDVESRHEFIMHNMTAEQVKFLHDEIAVLSGMPLPDDPIAETIEEGEAVEPNPKRQSKQKKSSAKA